MRSFCSHDHYGLPGDRPCGETGSNPRRSPSAQFTPLLELHIRRAQREAPRVRGIGRLGGCEQPRARGTHKHPPEASSFGGSGRGDPGVALRALSRGLDACCRGPQVTQTLAGSSGREIGRGPLRRALSLPPAKVTGAQILSGCTGRTIWGKALYRSSRATLPPHPLPAPTTAAPARRLRQSENLRTSSGRGREEGGVPSLCLWPS